MEYAAVCVMDRPGTMIRQETKIVGQRLKLTRLALGYKEQTQFLLALASVLEVAPGTWNHYEIGRAYPPPEVSLALCARFDLSMDWIFRGVRSGLPPYVREAIEAQEIRELGSPKRGP